MLQQWNKGRQSREYRDNPLLKVQLYKIRMFFSFLHWHGLINYVTEVPDPVTALLEINVFIQINIFEYLSEYFSANEKIRSIISDKFFPSLRADSTGLPKSN